MRTNIVLDDALVSEAFALTGARTKKELVNLALRELITQRRKKNLLDLAGKLEFAEGYDHKSLRDTQAVSHSDPVQRLPMTIIRANAGIQQVVESTGSKPVPAWQRAPAHDLIP